jgi:hypothetical protein
VIDNVENLDLVASTNSEVSPSILRLPRLDLQERVIYSKVAGRYAGVEVKAQMERDANIKTVLCFATLHRILTISE